MSSVDMDALPSPKSEISMTEKKEDMNDLLPLDKTDNEDDSLPNGENQKQPIVEQNNEMKKRKRESTGKTKIDQKDHENSRKDKKMKMKIEVLENNNVSTSLEISKADKDTSIEPKANDKSKRVSFSGKVEVFPLPETDKKTAKKVTEDNLVRGKKFTPEEDAILKQAVLDYIKLHNLGEEGLSIVLGNDKRGFTKCWKEIGACLPYRPTNAISYRGHILFERSETREWTKEETEFLKKAYKEHGTNWKMVANELGKSRIHVKDKWRRIKRNGRGNGKWTQEEYQKLYDLINLDLQAKVGQEKKSKHGLLRDNIPWGAITDKLATRGDTQACVKWYTQLTSSLVAENKWATADDYRLVKALYDLDAACVEDVDWDALLEHRPGEICRKRWDQMVRHVGHPGSMPFSEQVEVLCKRYPPELAKIREDWDNKPYV